MICNNCGRQFQNETANFCEYCGASFREQVQAAKPETGKPFYSIPGMQQEALPMNHQNIMPGVSTEMQEKPITFMSWLGTYAILGALIFIPYFGWIGFIAILLFWAFSNKTPATKKNWARVTLIFVGIVIIIAFIILIAFSSMYSQQILDGTFDWNNYSNNLIKSLQ
jgi:hypothetical protein